MKKKILFTLLITCCIFSSCNKDDLEYKDDFNKSYKAWLDFKNQTSNSYKYTTSYETWDGFSSETTISISSGKIIQRSYKYTGNTGIELPEEDLEWTENENEINTHPDGTTARTLDEVYEKAKNDWLKKRKNTDTFFEARNNGLISTCGYNVPNCPDNCFIGIEIIHIDILNN